MTYYFNLIDFASFLGYDFPEEIYEVAWFEGFYEREELTGDYFLSKDGINDFLNRLTHGEVVCTGILTNSILEIEEKI